MFRLTWFLCGYISGEVGGMRRLWLQLPTGVQETLGCSVGESLPTLGQGLVMLLLESPMNL